MPPIKTIQSILLIDDDPDEQIIIQAAIWHINPSLRIKQLTEGFIELEHGDPNQYDLILLDINMPQFDGFSWLAKLKHVGCTVPVVMYSTSKNPEKVSRSYKEGAALYFQKPDDYDCLLQSLEKLLSIDWNEPGTVKETVRKTACSGAFHF